MNVIALISSLFSPAIDLIKKYITKEEDQTKALAELEKVQAGVLSTIVELEKQKIELMKAEASSLNFITAAWRPMASLLIVGVALLASFGIGSPNEHFWNLADMFLGVYAGSRGLEKIASSIIKK